VAGQVLCVLLQLLELRDGRLVGRILAQMLARLADLGRQGIDLREAADVMRRQLRGLRTGGQRVRPSTRVAGLEPSLDLGDVMGHATSDVLVGAWSRP
jgi:hypothetical protein